MLEGLNLVTWSRLKRSKLSRQCGIYKSCFSEGTQAGREWRIYPFQMCGFTGVHITANQQSP